MKLLSLIFFLFIIPCSLAKAQNVIKIKNVKNNIFVLDNHGKRFALNKDKEIKIGDFLKTKDNFALMNLKNEKICFSKQSSLKIKKINAKKKLIEIEVRKGKFLFFIKRTSKLNFNFKLQTKTLTYNFGYIFLSKHSHKGYNIQTFKNSAYIIESNFKKTILKPNTFYILKADSLAKKKLSKFDFSYFLNECHNINYDLNSLKKKSYKCSKSDNKLSCGYK